MAKPRQLPRRDVAPLEAKVERARSCPGRYLLLEGWAYHPRSEIADVSLSLPDATQVVSPESLVRVHRGDVSRNLSVADDDRDHGFLLVIHLRERSAPPRCGSLNISDGTSTRRLMFAVDEEPDAEHLFGPIQNYAPEERRRIVRHLLCTLRDPLGASMPIPRTAPEASAHFLRACVDHGIVVPGKGVYLDGWLADPGGQVDAMYLHVPGYALSEDLAPRLIRRQRPDVVEAFSEHLAPHESPGFSCLVEIPNRLAGTGSMQACLLLLTRSGELLEFPTPFKSDPENALKAIERIFSGCSADSPTLIRALDDHIGPAVTALWHARPTPVLDVETTTFGTPPRKPSHSVIVPLYGRYDFIDIQLSQFVSDAEMLATQLIYVVDDPRIYPDVLRHCRDIHPIFNVPFSVVHAGHNLGYAGANNLGASCSSAPVLLLLNSDVIPKAPGWLGHLEGRRRALKHPGAIGPKLLYEDGSIQHVGISFAQVAGAERLWANIHPGKGQPSRLWSDSEPVAVPAVTGACLLIDRALYERVGGLDEGYILGDFEDSDLCLKLAADGYTNYCVPDVELYHLERHSFSHVADEGWRSMLTMYNCWKHTNRWGSIIGEIMDGVDV